MQKFFLKKGLIIHLLKNEWVLPNSVQPEWQMFSLENVSKRYMYFYLLMSKDFTIIIIRVQHPGNYDQGCNSLTLYCK